MADAAVAGHPRGSRPLAELRAAIGFLTRVPVAGRATGGATTGAAAFPIVGAAIGAAASVPVVVAGGAHPLLASILAVAIVAILGGALHLDGLADTIDALAAPPGAAERARTDPRAGTAGVVAIVVALGLEVAALAELAARGAGVVAAALVVAGAASRALAPAVAVAIGRRRGPGQGLGGWFAANVSAAGAAVAVGLAVPPLAGAVAVAPRLAAGALGGVLVAAIVAWLVVRARGQLDGDGYGFAIETTFALVLVAGALAA